VSDSIAQWERSLVSRIAAGDDLALAAAIDQYGAHVYGTAAHLAGRRRARDVVADVFTELWDHPDRIDLSVASLRVHLVAAARRRATDGRRSVGDDEPAALCVPIVPVPNFDEAAASLIAGENLRDTLARLPVQQREAITMAHRDVLTFREIAVRTGTSQSAAAARVRLGMRRLVRALRLPDQVGRA
jgi:RNA polymerase sigma factor (sigma-70 family)